MEQRFFVDSWKVELVKSYFIKSSEKKAESLFSDTPVNNSAVSPKPRVEGPPQFSDTVKDLKMKSPGEVLIGQEKEGDILIGQKKEGEILIGQEKEGEILPSSCPRPPPFRVCRPKLYSKVTKQISEKRKFPIQQMDHDEKDQGRNCVSVILKSSSSSPSSSKAEVSRRVLRVEELSAKYKVKYQSKSSQRVDFCFKSPTEARNFFRKVNDLSREKDSPKLMSVIMYSEESLGYQFHPVLTEKELLTVQSPNYISNIFKTSVKDIEVDINSSSEVSFIFRTVADVNAFLFEVSNKKGQRTLGELKVNTKNLVLKPQQGYFILNARDESCELEYFKGNLTVEMSGDSNGDTKLKFQDKLEMFGFLLSEEGKKIKQLSFDQSQILNSSRERNPVKSSELEADTRGLEIKEMEESGGDIKNNNHKVDIQEKELEVRLQDQMQRIVSIASSSCSHQRPES